MRKILIILIVAACGFYATLLAAQNLALPPSYDPKQAQPIVAAAPFIPPPAAADNYGQTSAIPATSYFPILPFDAGDDAKPQLLPVASNHPLDGDHAKISSAIIIIHDVSRDATGAVAMMTALAGGTNDSTMIVAPQFLLESDIAGFADHLPDEGRSFARWAMDSWITGDDSTVQAPQKGISSFTALDLLLIYLGDKEYFPNLKTIVIAGNGAGGDFVLRYAAAGQAPDVIGSGLDIRYAAANPSSYIYFTPLRPFTGKQGFTMPDAAKCPAYNSYKYGINELNNYARRAGANAIRLRYAARHVTYLTGERTTVNDRFPDTNCAALLQGPERLTRAKNYSLYINTIFGDDAKDQKFVIIPKAGYEPVAIFGSRCGMATLFGDGNCDEPPITGVEILQ